MLGLRPKALSQAAAKLLFVSLFNLFVEPSFLHLPCFMNSHQQPRFPRRSSW